MTMTASDVAHQLQGQIAGDGSVLVTGFSSSENAQAGDLTFAETPQHFETAERSQASVILVSSNFKSDKKTLILVPNARIAMARILPLFFPQENPPPEVHPTAVVAPSAQIHPTAYIGPHCVVSAGARLGARSRLLGGNHLGRDCQVGEDVCLFQNVVLYERCHIGDRVTIHAGSVIGSDGYGYVLDQGRHRKVLQVGNVVIHADVEIGANAAIDRGALGSTTIGQGTKIDNLVHVAHNVVIGKHCLILGQVGFAGSSEVGDYCVVASQSGIAGHLKLGTQSIVGAKSGVMRDVPAKETVLGIPAMPHRQTKRQWIGLQQLPEMINRLRSLEKQVAELKARTDGPSVI